MMHLGLGLGISDARGGGPPFVPTDLSSLAGWYDPAQLVSIGGVPLPSGTVPPAVTFTGTLLQSIGLWVQIDGAGSRGTATFKWGVLNPAGAPTATGVLTAATVALGSTGVTANFPVGAYLTDNVYEAVAASWDRVGQATNPLLQPVGSKQFKIIANAKNARPGLRSDLTRSSFMQVAVSLPQPHEVWCVGKFDDANTGSMLDGASGNTARLYRVGSTTVNIFGGAALGAATFTPESFHVLRAVYNSGSSQIYEDAVLKVSGNGGVSSSAGLTLGEYAGGSDFASCTYLEVVLLNALASAPDATSLLAYLRSKHAI